MQQPAEAISHLSQDLWERANQLHLCKVISEFAHESLIDPIPQRKEDDWHHFSLSPKNNSEIKYLFRAQKLSLNHWYIDKSSLKKLNKEQPVGLDSLLFILEFKDTLGIDEEMLPGYLEEITSTLYGCTYMLSKDNLSSKELVYKDYQTIEHAMTSGHPSFVANNGRIGFDTDDYRRYVPEADQTLQLLWLAGHKSCTAYHSIDSISYQTLLTQELGEEVVASFNQVLISKGLKPEDYFFIPVHPWQWYNKLAIVLAPDIANQNLILLGHSPDNYNVQQSLRTLYNMSHPEKFYTKTALSILNMGFVRGMGPENMSNVPPITTWIKETIGKDPYINSMGFIMLCEVASVGFRNFYYEKFGRASSYNKMLSALWRESPISVTRPEQQVMTMAALLHVDFDNQAMLPELIKASGKSISVWLRHYLRGYLKPLLHSFYQYDLAFMPHGENVILVMENHIPVKTIMKDITEEICIFRSDIPLPERAKRICVNVPDDIRMQHIFMSIFDGFFRFLTQILVEHCNYTDDEFWELVAVCIQEYQQENDHLHEKFERFDLFSKQFTRSCLNRLQLRNNKQMLSTADPLSSLQLIGVLKNPIARYQTLKIENHS